MDASLARADLTPGPNGPGVPVPGTLYLHQDLLGSTVLVTDPAGSVVTSVSYLPYGQVDGPRSSGPDIFRAKYSGNEWDESLGLYYFGARYYDPATAQFMSPDPEYQGYSPYSFVGNNPESALDPDGEFWFLAAVVIGVIAGMYGGAAAVNHNPNPADWEWDNGKTYAALLGGGLIGGFGGAASAALAGQGLALGIMGELVISGAENAAFTAMGGGSGKDILESFAEGAAFGLAATAGGAALGAVGSRLLSAFARRGAEAAEETAEGIAQGVRRGDDACSSFVAGTLVSLDIGAKPVEELVAGMTVWAHDTRTEKNYTAQITEVSSRTVHEVVTIETDESSVTATREHPFYVQGRGWVRADALATNDTLRTRSGTAAVKAVRVESRTQQVFSIGVSPFHDYFVADAELLVHNVFCPKVDLSRRPRWDSTVKPYLEAKQTAKLVGKSRWIRSAVTAPGAKKPVVMLASKKVLSGKRWATVWEIDHARAPYRSLKRLATKTNTKITAVHWRAINNYKANLRLITRAENRSHKFEPSDAAGDKAAKKILQALKLWS
jgi:RHS repeat-associated protein